MDDKITTDDDLIIPLAAPITVHRKVDGVMVEDQLSHLQMREPVMSDFDKVSASDPTMGQLLRLAANCCVNVAPARVLKLSSRSLPAVMEWVGKYLGESTPAGGTPPAS